MSLTQFPSLVEGFLAEKTTYSSTISDSVPTGIDWGLNSVVNCLEQLPAPPLTEEETSSRLLGAMSLEERTGLCEQLKLQPAPRPAHLPATVPTLLLNGKWDARTPAAYLSSFNPLPQMWQKVILNTAAHDLGWRTCPLSILSEFAKHPTQRVDIRCAARGELEFR